MINKKSLCYYLETGIAQKVLLQLDIPIVLLFPRENEDQGLFHTLTCRPEI